MAIQATSTLESDIQDIIKNSISDSNTDYTELKDSIQTQSEQLQHCLKVVQVLCARLGLDYSKIL